VSAVGATGPASDRGASTTPARRGVRRFAQRHPAFVGMPLLLILFLAVTVAIHPEYGSFDAQSLAMGAMPLAFAAAAQSVVVISAGSTCRLAR